MKQIILSCCVVALSYATVSAQTAATPPTKEAFIAKSTELDGFIAAGNMDKARATYTDLNRMMGMELGEHKQKMATATDEATKSSHLDKIKQESQLYSAIRRESADLNRNREDIKNKLATFAGTF